MRLVKLDATVLECPIEEYFTEVLPNRKPDGLFIFPGGKIKKDRLDVGETVLFSYKARLRYVATAVTGRLDNTYLRGDDYPHCFRIDMRSVRRADTSVKELEAKLRKAGCLNHLKRKSLSSAGWTTILGTNAEAIIDAYCI